MSDIEKQFKQIEKLNILQERNPWVNRRHPLVKLLLTFSYIAVLASCNKYQIVKVILLGAYPFMMFNFADLSLKDALYRMRLILPLVLAVGIFNPPIPMITLMLKGFFAVLSAYLLIATTSVEDICFALRQIYVPKIIVTTILLIHRYLYLLIQEVGRITDAYRLRAPRQRGIHYKVWGSLVGQWLIHSLDRAQLVYESMTLRGYKGEFQSYAKKKANAFDFLFLFLWLGAFILIWRFL